ncbi:MAG: ferrous iron transport protein B, partial [Planctomycetales bacterium]|nr:ferrous iron transport protein B [Planctomycetales bacterium]
MTTSILSPKADLTVALVGNPNTGKSTLFSALCGVPARIGNYPGVTVEKRVGKYKDDRGTVSVIDMPGTYSLTARTLDEKISVDVLLGRQADTPQIDAIVAIVDATNLERNLYLFTQLRDLQIPLVLVLNMWDRIQTSGIRIDVEKLQDRLGAAVITTVAAKRHGVNEIKSAVRAASSQCRPASPVLSEQLQTEISDLKSWIDSVETQALPTTGREFLCQRLIMDLDGALAEELTRRPGLEALPERLTAARQRLADSGQRVPGVETRQRYAWIRQQLEDIVHRPPDEMRTGSDRIDHILTHRIWGLVFFAVVMFAVFQMMTWGTDWLATGITDHLQPWLVDQVQVAIAPGPLRSLMSDGVIAGVGSVIVFLPQILVLFFFIGLLEDCGYMARAAFVMDKLMTKLGLSGKSFLPLMSSFACAVPGILATRVIENWRDRLITILIAPLMSCSARLPVYVLMIYTFVPDVSWMGGWIGLRGLVLFWMQSLGLLVAIPVAWIFKRYIFPGEESAFVMELPSYKLPSPRVVFFRVWERGQSFISRAGTLIFLTAIL